ncbi:MAG: class I SAM-dependent methyltransferase [Bacteroidota bacterium]
MALKEVIKWDIKTWSKALNFWEKEVDWSKINSCLELGGMQGGLSLWLALKNKKFLCSDLSNTKINSEPLHQKYKVGNFINYQDIDATNIPYENEFDLIVFKSIIGGIGRNDNKEIQRQVFLQIHKALKPGGKLLFAENLKGSGFHQMLRKKFVTWGDSWRYINLEEMKEFLFPFSSYKIHTAGVLATLGRSETQRNILNAFDNIFLNHLVSDEGKYMCYGIAVK